MGRYEIVDHTADVGVVATGKTLSDALASLAAGMFSVVADLQTVETTESITVSLASSDRGTLVVDWLNELLFRYDAHGFLPGRFDVRVGPEETSLEATCWGEPVEPTRHTLLTDVKAATYHGLEVGHDSEWRIKVVLDV